jgi:uncharacterized membrane-anchored protein
MKPDLPTKPGLVRVLIALGAVLIFGAVNFAIAGKEKIKRDGDIVYLRLAPVDPRSLMQGDYMALRFALAQELQQTLGDTAREGETRLARVTLDDKRIAALSAESSVGAAARQIPLLYRIRKGNVWLGTNAFFFEEGTGDRYSTARFGEFRVDRNSGEAILVALRNEALEPL